MIKSNVHGMNAMDLNFIVFIFLKKLLIKYTLAMSYCESLCDLILCNCLYTFSTSYFIKKKKIDVLNS